MDEQPDWESLMTQAVRFLIGRFEPSAKRTSVVGSRRNSKTQSARTENWENSQTFPAAAAMRLCWAGIGSR